MTGHIEQIKPAMPTHRVVLEMTQLEVDDLTAFLGATSQHSIRVALPSAAETYVARVQETVVGLYTAILNRRWA